MKYSVMKIRMKISYMAFEKNMTILELFYSTILKTYKKLSNEGCITESPDQKHSRKKILDSIINNGKDTVKMIF